MTTLFEFDFSEQMQPHELTPRQWKLYTFLKLLGNHSLKQERVLEEYETYLVMNSIDLHKYSFGYLQEKGTKHFSDMTSARNYRKDILVLKQNYDIQKVITTNKIAPNFKEAQKHVNKLYREAKKQMKLFRIEKNKLELDHQCTLIFNKERGEWISTL